MIWPLQMHNPGDLLLEQTPALTEQAASQVLHF